MVEKMEEGRIRRVQISIDDGGGTESRDLIHRRPDELLKNCTE